MRLDLARRTVVLDCAVLVVTGEVLKVLEERGNVERLVTPSPGYGVVKVDAEEMRLWKEMLPAWVERCREWTHRERCEYGRDGTWNAPVLVEMGGEVVCGCGKGVFPAGWKVDVPMWEAVKGHCVRAAIAPLFPSALAEDVIPDLGGNTPDEGSGGAVEGDGISGCRTCGKTTSKEGGELKACAKCLKVRYCGRPCQRADWKRHKKECVTKE
jgi:hypothetical protein